MGIMTITPYTSTIDTSPAPNRKIEYIVIHYTAGTQSRAGAAKTACDWWRLPDTRASADFVVDDEMILRYNPDLLNRYCWHCGGSKYSTRGGRLHGIVTNSNSIGIELCSTNLLRRVADPNADSWIFTEAVLKNAAELVRHLMQTYSIPLDRVVRHYDVTGKLCPGIPGWNEDSGSTAEWQRFLRLVENRPAETAPEGMIRLIFNDREIYLPGKFENGTNSISGTVREIFSALGAEISAQGTTPIIRL